MLWWLVMDWGIELVVVPGNFFGGRRWVERRPPRLSGGIGVGWRTNGGR